MRTFPLSPLTVVFGERIGIAESAQYFEAEGADAPLWQIIWSDVASSGYVVEEPLTDTPQEVQFKTPAGTTVTLRHVVESDAEAAGNHPFFPNYPLPVDVIGAIMQGNQGPTDLYAVVDGNGSVNTLALVTNTGMYLRYGRAWQEANSRAVMGRSLVPIDDLEVEAYDQADEAGQQLTRDMVSVSPRSAPVVRDMSPMTNPVTASAPIVAPIVSSLEDAETAIPFAQENPSARWYITKRLRALGYTDSFPWEGE